MPVDFREYDPDDGGIRLTEGSNAHAILQFLAANPEQGFTPREHPSLVKESQDSGVFPSLCK